MSSQNVEQRKNGKLLQNVRLAAVMEGCFLLILTAGRNILINWGMCANERSQQ